MSQEHRWIDVTRPLHPGFPVWPGDAPCRLAWTSRMEAGASANVSELAMSAHTGTHVDAPLHVRTDGSAIGAMPPSAFVGPAVVMEASGQEWIDTELVERVLGWKGVERVLFRTGCWKLAAGFPERFPAFTPEAAMRLRDAGVVLVGTDAPSVDPFESEFLPVHRILAEGEVAIVENLLLDEVEVGEYEMIALPLRLAGADASPVRAVLRRR